MDLDLKHRACTGHLNLKHRAARGLHNMDVNFNRPRPSPQQP
jgi:hypothetical protein